MAFDEIHLKRFKNSTFTNQSVLNNGANWYKLSNFESGSYSDGTTPYNSFSSKKSAGGDSWTVDTDIAAVEEEGEEDKYPETVANLEELHVLVVKFLE